MDECKTEGIFKLTGRFSDDIQESIRQIYF